MRKQKRLRMLIFLVGITGVIILVLSGPVATWLQRRDLALSDGTRPEALYLVAGASQQGRRISALVARIDESTNQPMILVGNDGQKGKWSKKNDRNLTAGEWAEVRLLGEIEAEIRIVPGEFSGTDGEMAALGRYLAENTDIESIALVTSGFHVRRLVGRLESYLQRDMEVYVIRSGSAWQNRAPWIVALELLKMIRDSVGLSRTPLLSREPVG